jgi:GT2 family glycosyltransferase
MVIVNWNTRDLLLGLLGSLLPDGSPTAGTEVIVVDNQSQDGSVEAAHELFPQAHVVAETHNFGFAHGVNRGIAIARGEWVLLLNTDAEADPKTIAALVAEADLHPDAAIFGPRIIDEHGNPQRSTWPRHRPWSAALAALVPSKLLDPGRSPAQSANVDCVSGCVYLVRRSAFVTLGGFDERFFLYFEEADFCERARRHGFGVRHLPATSFVHRGGLSAAQAAVRTFLAFRESMLLYHAAFFGRWAAEWVRAWLLLGSLIRLPLCVLRPRRIPLHAAAIRWLARPTLVRELARRSRAVPVIPARARA